MQKVLKVTYPLITGIHIDNYCIACMRLKMFIFTFIAAPYRRDGVVVGASASQSVDLGFIPLVESYQKTLKNGIHSFPAWRSAFSGGCGEQAGKLACCILGQDT